MHRAEKASSKLCREREVEKAQQLHRRKIGGVKSYLSSLTKPSAPLEPKHLLSSSSTFFRRRQRHKPAQQQAPPPPPTPTDTGGNDTSDDDSDDDHCSHGSDDHSFISEDDEDDGNDEMATPSFGKLDELRSVLVPVMAHKSQSSIDFSSSASTTTLDYERLLDQQLNADAATTVDSEPPSIQHQSSHSLRARAFRMRRLKQIEAANATLLDRIKHSTAHYKTDAFKKDWHQNVAYLSSICEFPVLTETLHPSPLLARRLRRTEPLPTTLPVLLPAAATATTHPIKAVLTSPRKPKQLNLAPAFRSLRKGLPQVPSLPPLSAAPSPRKPATSSTTALLPHKPSMTAVAGSRHSLHSSSAVEEEEEEDEQEEERRRPASPDPPCDDPTRYTLLTRGRFIGGKYLILTVHCGDGITNPYGFDVVAKDPSTRVEFALRVTKHTTHRLLDTISSSSMAEKTAAAAGTNLSMELLAQCIVDHVRYADLGRCEVVFLVATVGTRGRLRTEDDGAVTLPPPSTSSSDGSHLLLDTPHDALALCFHQRVRDGERWLDVLASTRPQQSCHASMTTVESESSTGEGCGLVWFEARDEGDAGSAECHVSVDSLVQLLAATDSVAAMEDASQRLSLDRLVMLSMAYLHYEPGLPTPRLTLVPTVQNNWTGGAPLGSPRRPSTMALPASPTHRHRSSSSVPSPPLPTTCVLQSGMLWRGAFLFVRVALLRVSDEDELLLINVFNASTGSYAERTLDGAAVDALSASLGAWQAEIDPASSTPFVLGFAKRLLLLMALKVDLRDHEVITFPSLEPRGSRVVSRGGRHSPMATMKRRAIATALGEAEAETVEQTQCVDHGNAPFLESLQQEQHDFVERHAARCIQHACRSYARRKNAHANGIALKTAPRAMTPSATAQRVDRTEIGESDGGSGEENDDDEDGDESEHRRRRVDILGSLVEGGELEEERGSQDLSRVAAAVDGGEKSARRSHRVGARLEDQLVLLRSVDASAQSELLECFVVSDRNQHY